MGGSGTAPTGGGGITGGSDCPRKFETELVDVAATGNVEYALSLKPGDKLDLRITGDSSAVALLHGNTNIGYLPPQRSNIIQCIENKWVYSASIISITGNGSIPKIRVLVVGTPN